MDILINKNVQKQKRNVEEDESISGHKYITYEIQIGSKKETAKTTFDFESTNWEMFKSKLKIKLAEMNLADDQNIRVEQVKTACK